MKFKDGQSLYYVNPFVFEIERVTVQIAVAEIDGIYYIDEVGAFLAERDLFEFKDDAKQQALAYLRDFALRTEHKIYNA